MGIKAAFLYIFCAPPRRFHNKGISQANFIYQKSISIFVRQAIFNWGRELFYAGGKGQKRNNGIRYNLQLRRGKWAMARKNYQRIPLNAYHAKCLPR